MSGNTFMYLKNCVCLSTEMTLLFHDKYEKLQDVKIIFLVFCKIKKLDKCKR